MGSREHGYDITAPVDADGHLVRKPGGSWAFHYDIHCDEDDELRTFKVISARDIKQ